ncbi:hypothetical protein B7463_g10416, partial [Scytalidium lignicola]
MAKIYSKATRVLVWLGETADNSDVALERISIAAENESPDSFHSETAQQSTSMLLQRPWFRRIWVLQEVSAARQILIMCGSMEIDGYAFCLGELVDMFHTHEATKPVNKVYALLGMSSDNPGTAGLLPDYEVGWEKLFKDLVKFLLYKQVYVKTWCDEMRAVIKSKGCVLGKVLSVDNDDKHKVNIRFKNMTDHLEYKRDWSDLWTLQASAKHILKGDIVCLLQGASKPMIIRPSKGYFTVIRIAAVPEEKLTKDGDIEWSKLLRSIIVFPYDLLLIWNWENALEKLQDPGEYEALARTNNWMSEHSKTELRSNLDEATKVWNDAMILDDVEEYKKAEEKLREAIEGYEIAFGKKHLHMLKGQYGRTPLSWAAGNGYDMVVGLLLVKDIIYPDLKDSQSGRTPLSWAAGGGHDAVVQLLISTNKVEFDSKDNYSQTPLSWAAMEGHKAIVQLLLATSKVEIDFKDNSGRTPLSWAAMEGHKAVVQLLLATGKVEIDFKDNSGQTPLSWAAMEGHKATVQSLLATKTVKSYFKKEEIITTI